jgi:hypothetical protein
MIDRALAIAFDELPEQGDADQGTGWEDYK